MNLAFVGNAFVFAIELAVAGRLFWKAISRRALPELLLGWQLLSDALEWIFWLIAIHTPLAGTPAAEPLVIGCRPDPQ